MLVQSSHRDYEVQVTADFSEVLREAGKIPGIFTLIDEKVYGLYKAQVDAVISAPIFTVAATEENKTYEKTGELIQKLLAAGLRKSNHLLVIGGGVTQDIGGFMASVISRGIEYTLIPTTLLAQCDSCIGSKTSINIGNFKNQLGTFYPPVRVLIPASVLQTLTPGDLHSGVCEALKLAMIEGPQDTDLMSVILSKGLSPGVLQKVVMQSLEIKKNFIEEDEFDKGRRNLLNYGHTFGHAFETATKYKIPHGVAVGIGIMTANYFSWKREMISEDDYRKASELMKPWCGDSLRDLSGLRASALLGAMKADKKSTANQIGFILTLGYGKMERVQLDFAESERLLDEWLLAIK